MTAVLFLLTGITVTVVPSVIAVNLRAEANHWHRYRVEAAKLDVLYHDNCHLERHNRRLTDEHTELREGVGELLDRVAADERELAAKDRQIDALTNTGPVPVYGAGRVAHVRTGTRTG